MQKKDSGRIKQEFRKIQNRQIVAMAAAMFIVLLAAVLHKRPDLVGAFSRRTLFALQAVSVAAFLGFTAYNWRCPSCRKHLGGDVLRLHCKNCGSRLQ